MNALAIALAIFGSACIGALAVGVLAAQRIHELRTALCTELRETLRELQEFDGTPEYLDVVTRNVAEGLRRLEDGEL